MNIFRLCGDMLHLLSIILLLMKIRKSKNCAGISCRTQELYLLVFCTRYLDLFLYWVSLYNTVMKLAFIGLTAYILYLMRFKAPYCITYDKLNDSFPHWLYLVAPCAVLGIVLPSEYDLIEMLWSFSLYLEAVAIFPQLVMLQRLGEVENLTSHYVGALGAYRFFYILNWIYKSFGHGHVSWLAGFTGLIQTVLYVDFFYYYFQSRTHGQNGKFTLPA
eukprot:GILJ01004420.1.p1 GENE.GILJ01004420.1~~GILJ01004420.1.p1  ORF type:complete len:245 (+),score=22.75 GILJ01004420.1:84-737(+)